MKFPVFDLHCDTALELLGHDFKQSGDLRNNAHHIDLQRAKSFPAYAQCFACFTSSEDVLPLGVAPEEIFAREVNTITSQIDKNRDVIRQAYSAEDIEQNCADGYMSAILTIEGTAGFGFDTKKLPELIIKVFVLPHLAGMRKIP